MGEKENEVHVSFKISVAVAAIFISAVIVPDLLQIILLVYKAPEITVALYSSPWTSALTVTSSPVPPPF